MQLMTSKGGNVSVRKIKRSPQMSAENHKMELFNMYRQLADLWKNTGELYSHVDGEKTHTERCFRLGAEALENASTLLAATAKRKELEIAELEEQLREAEREGE